MLKGSEQPFKPGKPFRIKAADEAPGTYYSTSKPWSKREQEEEKARQLQERAELEARRKKAGQIFPPELVNSLFAAKYKNSAKLKGGQRHA